MFAIRGNGVKAAGRAAAWTARQSQLSTSTVIRPLNTPAVFKKKVEPPVQDTPSVEKVEHPKQARPARQTSLRRVGLEAEKKRVVVRNRGGIQVIERGHGTKKATAYCAAEQYNIHTAARLLEADGFVLDPFGTGLYPQVIHVQGPILPSVPSGNTSRDQEHGDLFIFPSGTVVAWNVSDRIALRLVERVLPPAAVNSDSGYVQMETEDLEYIEDSTKERSSIVGDTIRVGTKPDSRDAEDTSNGEESALESVGPEKSTVLAKIAFSSGLSRSTKLAILERLTESYLDSTRSIPTTLSQGTHLPFDRPLFLRKALEMVGIGTLPFSRTFILRKTGELLSIRAQLNLYSELTDSLPDLFWESAPELGLEGYYDRVGSALDVGIRIKVLNAKLDYAQEIASMLRETLSERHSVRLEIIIIVLIAIEVGFEFWRKWKESREKYDPESLENLLRRYLKAASEEGKKSSSHTR